MLQFRRFAQNSNQGTPRPDQSYEEYTLRPTGPRLHTISGLSLSFRLQIAIPGIDLQRELPSFWGTWRFGQSFF
jgi:hypothetical protein